MDFTKLWRKGVTAFVIPHVVKDHCNFRSGILLVWSSRNQENSCTTLKRGICTDFKATKHDPHIFHNQIFHNQITQSLLVQGLQKNKITLSLFNFRTQILQKHFFSIQHFSSRCAVQ